MAQSESEYICQCNIDYMCKIVLKSGCYGQNLFATICQEKPLLYCNLKQKLLQGIIDACTRSRDEE